jgi:hypothetical protein
MKPENFYLINSIKKAEEFDYRKISEQVKNLIEVLSQNPAQIERKKYPQISDRVFEFLKSGAFNNLPEKEKEIVLFYLLTTPSPREQDKILNSISFLFEDPESFEIKSPEALMRERKNLIEYLILQETLEVARRNESWVFLLSFYQNPENQKIRPDILQEALEVARINGWWGSLLSFYQNPETQKIRPDILQEALEVARREGLWGSLLSFFQNPENQNKFQDIFEEALEVAIRDGWWYSLLSFFQNPENQPKGINENLLKAEKSLSLISDKNLRVEFLIQLVRYLANNESLVLISLSSTEDLPFLIAGKILCIDPLVIQSWGLSEEERESLLPVFLFLVGKGIRFNFPFPYRPRPELKKTRKHNKMLISYFRTLYFILSLQTEFEGVSLIQTHFENIQNIIPQPNIEGTQPDITYKFLRGILREIKSLEENIINKIKELLEIRQDISNEEIKKNIMQSPYFPIIFTLAVHYSAIYKDGLPLLRKIFNSLIKDPSLGDYFQMRYDLSDQITKAQLSPLLEGKNPEEYPQIIEQWRNPYYTFKILSQEERERIKIVEINWYQVWEHIKSQTYGEKHYEQLFKLEEFKNLDEEIKNKIREIIDIIFTSEKKTINLSEIRKILKGKLDENKINILIGYFQLLKDLSLKQKTPQEILSTIERLNNKITNNWQKFGQLTIWQQDIYNYLIQLIKEQEQERRIIRKQTILLSYLTDHPGTLLKIGKYPINTCQDYESTDTYNKALLGYVFDAHIKALVLREIKLETEEEINEEDLNQAKVEIDEEKDTIKITLPNGKTVEGKMSKPISRRIVMLGEKEGKPTLLLEPIYGKYGKGDETYKEFLDIALKKIQNDLGLEIFAPKTEVEGETISLPPSHNKEGYYRDF